MANAPITRFVANGHVTSSFFMKLPVEHPKVKTVMDGRVGIPCLLGKIYTYENLLSIKIFHFIMC